LLACTKTSRARSTRGPSCQSSDPLPSHCNCLCTSSTTTASASGLNNRKTSEPFLCVGCHTWSLDSPSPKLLYPRKRTAESHSRDDEQRALIRTANDDYSYTEHALASRNSPRASPSPLASSYLSTTHHPPHPRLHRLHTITSNLTRHPNPRLRNGTQPRIVRAPQRASTSVLWINSPLLSSRYPKLCCQTSAVL